MRSVRIIGALAIAIVLASLLLENLTHQELSELEKILISRFLFLAIGTCSVMLSTVHPPEVPLRVSRFAIAPRRPVKRYTHDMFAASLTAEVTAILEKNAYPCRINSIKIGLLMSKCIRGSLHSALPIKVLKMHYAVCLRPKIWK